MGKFPLSWQRQKKPPKETAVPTQHAPQHTKSMPSSAKKLPPLQKHPGESRNAKTQTIGLKNARTRQTSALLHLPSQRIKRQRQ